MHTVLIVDDTKENIKVLAGLLEKEYKTVIANSGEKALSILQRKSVDLILLDVLMPPGINGFETCTQIKNIPEIASIPIIFITALNDKESLIKGFSVGGIDYITKPFIHEEVLARVKVHTEHYSMINARNIIIKNLEQVADGRDLEFANMSHELRTPLNAMIGYSEMIEDDIEEENQLNPDDLKKDIKKITTASHYLLKLVNEILDISKIEADRMEVNCIPFPISEIINEVLTFCTHLVKKNNNSLLLENTDTVINVIADYTRTQQILLNLLSNACKFTSDGTITIAIHTMGNKLSISIIDTGIGMSKDGQNKLFKPFSQVTKDTASEYGGTGLGLTLSKRFSELMGGSITMKSELGKGSEFTLVLPIEVM
jgi:signal transduction histidine kinase